MLTRPPGSVAIVCAMENRSPSTSPVRGSSKARATSITSRVRASMRSQRASARTSRSAIPASAAASARPDASLTATAAAPPRPAARTAGSAAVPRAPITRTSSSGFGSAASAGSRITTTHTSTPRPYGAVSTSTSRALSALRIWRSEVALGSHSGSEEGGGEQPPDGPILHGHTDRLEHGPPVGLRPLRQRGGQFGQGTLGDAPGGEGVDDLAGLFEHGIELVDVDRAGGQRLGGQLALRRAVRPDGVDVDPLRQGLGREQRPGRGRR